MAKGKKQNDVKAAYAQKRMLALTGKQVIFDEEFNLARRIVPMLNDGIEHEIELSDETILTDVALPPHIRKATEEECTRWIEIHQYDEWYVYLQEQLKAKKKSPNYAPEYIVADGFGRWKAHVKKNGMDAALNNLVLDTDDPIVGACVSMHLNNNQRSIHPLDMSRLAVVLKKERKLNQTNIAALFGVSKGYMSQVMQCNKLTEGDRAKAINEKWSLQKILNVVAGYNKGEEVEGVAQSSSKGKAPSRKNIMKIVDKTIPFMIGQLEVQLPDDSEFNMLETVQDENSEDYTVLVAVQTALEWVDGRYPNKSLLDALKENVFLSEYELDFDELTKQLVKATK